MASALICVAQCSASDTTWPSTKTLGASGSVMAASPNRRVKYAKLGPKPMKIQVQTTWGGWINGVKPGALKKVVGDIYNPPIGQVIPLIYCLLGDYISPTTYSGNQKQLLSGTWVPNVQKQKNMEKKHVFLAEDTISQVVWIINNI